MRRSIALLMVGILAMGLSPQTLLSAEDTSAENPCTVFVDWSDGVSFEHAYRIVFDGSTSIDIQWAEIKWSHENSTNVIHQDNSTIDLNLSEHRIVLPTDVNLSETILIDVIGAESNLTPLEQRTTLCSRAIEVTYWNQPTADHEITRATSWSLEQNGVSNEEYYLDFVGQGWQQRDGNLLTANELGSGNITIITDDGDTRTETELELSRVWLNETMTDTVLNEQTFEMHGNGSTTFILVDEIGSETVAHIDVRDSYIVRTIANGIPSETVRIEGSGNLNSNGANDGESINITGEVAVFLFELETVDGQVTNSNYRLEAFAEMLLIDNNDRFQIDLDEFILVERWEDGEQIEQLSRIKGDGSFDFAESEDGATIVVNGTVPVFWLESQNGLTTVNTIHMDGDISGDIDGRIGLIVEIVEQGPQQNATGETFDVNVIRSESWLNITQVTGIGSNLDIEAEHNLTFDYQVPEEHWRNRTVRYRYVEDGGQVNNEYPERSPIPQDLPEPSNESILGSVNISRELGYAPATLVPGDALTLDTGDTLVLHVEAVSVSTVNLDGHVLPVTIWNGTFEEGGIATGSIINEGILAGLIANVTRQVEIELEETNLTFTETQALERILAPSIVTEAENTPPTLEEIRFQEGRLNAEGGEAHIEVVVSDPDWNVKSVQVDLSSIGLGTVVLNDIGSDGDDTVHDDIWTAHIQHLGIEYGEFNLNVTISDGWSTIVDQDSVTIDNFAPRLKSVEYEPQVVRRGDSMDVTIEAEDLHGVASVSIDLQSKGGNLTNLVQGTNGKWSGSIVVPPGMSPGLNRLTFTLVDEEDASRITDFITGFSGESETAPQFTILNEGPALNDLVILRDAKAVDALLVPDVGEDSIEHIISIHVTDPDGISAVQARLGTLAAIGEGDDWTRLVDDGTNGDPVAGDGNYSVSVMTRSTMPIGTMDIEIRGIDNFLEPTPGDDRIFSVTLSDTDSEIVGGWTVQTGILVMIAIIALLAIGGVGVFVSLRGADFSDETL